MKKSNKFIFVLFIVLIIFLTISFWWADNQFDFQDTFAYKNFKPLFFLANFDGVHYLQIAEQDYKSAGGIQAFFPFYPILIKTLHLIIPDYLFSALLISIIFFLASLFRFWQLLKLEKYSDSVIKQSLIFLTFFTSSFYFLSAYNESLFLFLTLSCFYYLKKNQIFKASLFAALACTTRLTGIFLAPVLAYEIFLDNKSKAKIKHNLFSQIKKLLKLYYPVLISTLGLLAYMIYLEINFKDALLFVHVQSGFGAGRETSKLVLPYQVIWRYLRMFFTVDKTNPIFYTICLEFYSFILFFSLLIVSYFKKINIKYIIYSALSLFLPTLTGTLSSIPRYVLVLFPVYIALALIQNKFIKYFIFIINLILLFYNFALFSQGYWVS